MNSTLPPEPAEPEESGYSPPTAPLADPKGSIDPDPGMQPLPLLTVFVAGALYGLLMRLAFGGGMLGHLGTANAASGPMAVSYLFVVPFVIGCITIFGLAPERRTLGRSLFMPWVALSLFIGGSLALLLEGAICIIIAMPIFMVMSSLGGLIGWAVLKAVPVSRGVASSVLLLPLVGGVFERSVALPDERVQIDRALHIAAPPEKIWQLINHATDIQPAEVAQGYAYRIGVPYPVEAITVDAPLAQSPTGRVRKLRRQKNVHFDEPILDWEENRYIRWRYEFAPDSIPVDALDEHVAIGGKYFDLIDTSYRLTPEDGGTRLAIQVHYRVSTNFNGYALWLGDLLVGDAAGTILNFYKQRCEAAAAG